MSFSPSVYGERTATVLNTLMERFDPRGDGGYHDVRFHTFTEPEGTLLEAALLFSCNNIGRSPLYQTLSYVNPQDELFDPSNQSLRHFFKDPAQFDTMVEMYPKTRDQGAKDDMVFDIQKSVVNTFLECRKSIRQISGEDKTLSSSPVFSDGLFGPHVAKVMNSLLEAEIEFTENYGVNPFGPPSRWYSSTMARAESVKQDVLLRLVNSDEHHSQERRPFALRSGKGTAFAGDMLVRMHAISFNHERFNMDSVAAQKVRDALFPEFEYGPRGEEVMDTTVYWTLQNVRLEMDFVTRIVHGEALPVLMAGIPRLGSGSVLCTVDKEVLCMIARLVIFG
jgi:hypothetical protein